MTSPFKLSKDKLKIYLPFIISLVCISLLAFFYVSNSNQKKAAYAASTSKVLSLTQSLDQTFSQSLDTLKKLSTSKEALIFAKSKSFDPINSLNTYHLFSKSFNTANHHNTYMGIYNPHLDMVVSNLGSSPLTFLLQQHNFSNPQGIYDEVLSSPPSQFVYQSKCGNYLLYILKNTTLLEAPISLALFNVDYLTQNLSPQDATLDFSLVLDKDTPNALDTYNFVEDSTILPITYVATYTLPLADAPLSNILYILVICILVVSFYFCYKHTKLITSLHTIALQQRQNLLLKEVIYGIKNPNIKSALVNAQLLLLNDTFFTLFVTTKESSHPTPYLTTSELETLLNTRCSGVPFKIVMLDEKNHIIFLTASSRQQLCDTLKSLTSPLCDYYLLLSDRLSISDVSSHYIKLTQILKNHEIMNRPNLILIEDIKIKLPVSYTFTDQDKKLLRYYINTQNEENFLTFIDKILTDNLLSKKLSPEFYEQFLRLMCEELQNISDTYKDITSIFEHLILLTNPSEVKAQLYHLFESYYLHITVDSPKNDMQTKFLEYIHTHYQEDISLADMAIHFNLAVNYVGVLFKEKTSYNFKDYLNTYRIKMAKELLDQSPQIKIKDLSLEVGFVNINTFIRIFKKYEGVSPGQYQKYLLDKSTSNTL